MNTNLHQKKSESSNSGLDSADSGFCGFWNNDSKHEDKSNSQNPIQSTWILKISKKFPVSIWGLTLFSESKCSPIYLRYIYHTPALTLGSDRILDFVFGREVWA